LKPVKGYEPLQMKLPVGRPGSAWSSVIQLLVIDAIVFVPQWQAGAGAGRENIELLLRAW
jgi:hypothetical protein